MTNKCESCERLREQVEAMRAALEQIAEPAIQINDSKWFVQGKEAARIAVAALAGSPVAEEKTSELAEARRLLDLACLNMERARSILTNDNPRPECNWGLLDTSSLRKFLAAPSEGRGS